MRTELMQRQQPVRAGNIAASRHDIGQLVHYEFEIWTILIYAETLKAVTCTADKLFTLAANNLQRLLYFNSDQHMQSICHIDT